MGRVRKDDEKGLPVMKAALRGQGLGGGGFADNNAWVTGSQCTDYFTLAGAIPTTSYSASSLVSR